jgi:hypothetical protein
MIRYRCPHCAALAAAHERRAGQSSVCKACFKPHQIPADDSQWLNEAGELLHPPAPEPTALAQTAPERAAEPVTASRPEADTRPVPAGAQYREQLAPTVPEIKLPERRAAESPPPQLPEEDATPAPTPTPTLPVPAPREPEPVQLQTQAEIAAALTAALASRMKPPPAPRRDLRPSTAAWMLLAGLGAALVLLALFVGPAYRLPALAVGFAQVAVGYVWIVHLTGQRDSTRGLLCAIPPLTFYYLTRYKYARLRPLRFVATGAAIMTLAAAAPTLAAYTRPLVQREPPVAPVDPESQSKLVQLRTYRDQRAYDSLIKLLGVLAKTDSLLSEDAKDRAELAAELKALCRHPLTDVRVHAMAAYARWDPDNARAVCLAAVRSETQQEREMALQLLPQWKDAEVARAVQSLIGRPGAEASRARAALEEIGGAPAEQAAIALLNRADDQATKLTALGILEKVGGAETAALLRSYAQGTDDLALRTRALAVADAIDARVRKPAP